MKLPQEPYLRRAFYYETDQMGIVHHSNYVRYLEEARLDYMRQAGMEYTDLEAHGILMPVVEIHCRYQAPVGFDDWMRIETKLTRYNGIRATYTYQIFRSGDGALALTATSEHCFLDHQTRRPVRLQKAWPACDADWRLLMQLQQQKTEE